MSRAPQPAASSRAGANFEIEQLEIADGHLVISGYWSGVRGIRFVRPTLDAGGRRLLATLEHKPWAPTTGVTWTAAFPWKADGVDVDALSLAVAPSVTVSLGAQAAEEDEPALTAVPADAPAADADVVVADPPPRPPAETVSPARLLRVQDDLAALTLERDGLARRVDEVQALNADLDVRCLELEQAMHRERGTARNASDIREDLERARTSAERDRDRALAQLDEAVQDREAALRTRARMEIQRDEALQVREAAEAKLAKAIADRDEANAQRDEVLLAYRALQRQMVSERADADREQAWGSAAAASDDRASGDARDAEKPLGVRTMPAGRTVMAELQRPKRERGQLLSDVDLWVMRVLGTVAALCFISLLVMILRVFI